VGGDAAVAAETGDDCLGEPLAAGGAAALAVEDPGDGGVVVVGGESGQQRDGVLVGADGWLSAGERDNEPGQRAGLPADRDLRLAVLAVDVEDHFVDQAAQQLFAVAVGGARRGPDAAEVGAECEQTVAFGVGQDARALLFAEGQLGFGLGQLRERFLPVAFQAAGDQAVFGLDLAVATLGLLGRVSGLLDLQAPVREGCVVVGLERFGCRDGGFDAGGRERGEQRARDGLVDLPAADPQAPFAAVLDQDASGAVVVGALLAGFPLVVDLELASAAAADRDALQQRAALAHGAAGLAREGGCCRRSARGWPRTLVCR
jgi:hypothetical protein